MTDMKQDIIEPLSDNADAIVSVRDLWVEFQTPVGLARALNGASFDVPRGMVIGIVGESGCGKSVTARAIMQIIERPGKITEGSIEFNRQSEEEAAAEILSDTGDTQAAT